MTSSCEQVLKRLPQIFTGTGCLHRQNRMVLQEFSVPVVQMTQRVPQALQEPLRRELDRRMKAGIVTRVEEPTD